MKVSERIRGAIVGLAAGDALGVPVEFSPRQERMKDPVRDMRSFGTHNQPAGTWSDDTSLAMCTLESILAAGFDLHDLARRFIDWSDNGYWTAHGNVFDRGIATAMAIERLKSKQPPEKAGGNGERDNGNGSLMRILPASIYASCMPDAMAARFIALHSSLTHAHPRSRLSCIIFSLLVSELSEGANLLLAVASVRTRLDRLLTSASFAREYSSEMYAYGSLLEEGLVTEPDTNIPSTGYVVDTLKASLWCALTTTSYRDCVLRAVNLGEDTDTVGAVAGGTAGLLTGMNGIPEEWRTSIARSTEIEERATRLSDLVEQAPPFPNSYFVLPGKLAAGEYPGDRDADQTEVKLAQLLDAGIEAVIDLTEEGEHTYTVPLRPYHADLQRGAAARGKECIVTRVAIRDGSVPDDGTLTRALDGIDASLSEGKCVYVHCWGGHGRTGLVIGCWLMRHGLADAESVLRILKELRKDMPKADRLSPETNEQREKVVHRGERE